MGATMTKFLGLLLLLGLAAVAGCNAKAADGQAQRQPDDNDFDNLNKMLDKLIQEEKDHIEHPEKPRERKPHQTDAKTGIGEAILLTLKETDGVPSSTRDKLREFILLQEIHIYNGRGGAKELIRAANQKPVAPRVGPPSQAELDQDKKDQNDSKTTPPVDKPLDKPATKSDKDFNPFDDVPKANSK